MTKQRHCYVTDVGNAIEKLADALDPERKPPFKGDILDLLEWAAKDVLEMRQQLAALQDELEVAKNVANGNVEAKFDAWRQLGACDKQLSDSQKQVTLLRDALKCYAHMSYGFYWSPITGREEPRMVAQEALAVTEPKP